MMKLKKMKKFNIETDMDNNIDIRWKQRFNNFTKAYQELFEVVELSQQRDLSKLEKQGLIQCFEYTHELAWNVLKDYLEEQGFISIIGSKNATREAFKQGIIEDGEMWMQMIKDRNLTSHTYDQDLAEQVIEAILNQYYPVFSTFSLVFTKRYEAE